MKLIALRIDVDTLRGTGHGVPVLNSIMDEFKVKGTYYFSVGPDNMGRHLWRLLKPKFLWKMLRTNAGGLYGYDIVFMGTAWPGPNIGRRCAGAIREAAGQGHEIGFHAWDHYSSQAKIDRWSAGSVRRELERGCSALEKIVGRFPTSSATPGWRCNDAVLLEKSKLPFVYNSDCRGVSPFYPVVGGRKLDQLQIPVTLPTYDEALGRNGVTDENYNDHMLSLLSEDRPNVLTIHAEAEGGKCADMFRAFLKRCSAQGWKVVTLGELAAEYAGRAPDGRVVPKSFPGREGWLACQE
ncbi:MAG: polysaccharide deacetylase family protein [Victivallaceae bacterium]|nr:polysaccharide deacetylase family protein [Victivallaceae bacterium]